MARLTGIQRIMEVGMMISCVFAFFLLLAMASFHPADPGWSQAGLQSDVHNWVGPIGAWFADILFFILGSFAYSLPFCCAFLGWFLFQQTKTLLEIEDRKDFMLQEIGIDITAYEDMFFRVIENLFKIAFSASQTQLIQDYIYSLKPDKEWDGYVNIKLTGKEEQIVDIKTPEKLWRNLIADFLNIL